MDDDNNNDTKMSAPMRPFRTVALTAMAAAAVVLLAGVAAADSIYMKNGRVIRTSSARIEGDRVIFTQYGSEVAIPLALVERIEEDGLGDPEPTPTTPAPTPERQTAGAAASAGGAEEGAEAEGEEVPPEQTREYWQDRVRAIHAEQEALEEQLVELRRQQLAMLVGHRTTTDINSTIDAALQRLAELQQALPDLRREARQLGIPAGWLRLRASERSGQ